MDIRDLFKILSDSDKKELRMLLQSEERTSFELMDLKYKGISRKMYDAIHTLHSRGLKYLKDVEDDDILSIRGCGKKTLVEFNKLKDRIL